MTRLHLKAMFALFSLLCLSLPSQAQAIKLAKPIRCILGSSCFVQNYVDRDPSPTVGDYMCARRTYDGHNGTDFRIPSMRDQRAGVEVMAAAAGEVTATRDGVEDISIRQRPNSQAIDGRECGNGVVVTHGGGWSTQYCHLARGSVAVRRGDRVEPGRLLGRVGLSGKTEFPHLHLTVRKDGNVVDPFSTEASGCGLQKPLWDEAFLAEFQYQAGGVLNAGITDAPIDAAAFEEQAPAAQPSRQSAMLIAFVHWIGLQAGDQTHVVLRGPDGAVLARRTADPLAKDRAEQREYAGRKAPAGGWRAGTYTAEFWVDRNGARVLQKQLSVSF